MDPSKPFVLLDDASRDGDARLFENPVEVIEAQTLADVRPALRRLREAGTRGLWATGFLGFDAGYALEPRLARLARAPRDGLPLLWFGLFDRSRRVAIKEIAAGRASVAPPASRLDEAAYTRAVARAQALIGDGDIYQVNLTFPNDVTVAGHPLSIYARLRGAAAAPYGAVVHTGGAWALSFSPELFFTLAGGRLTTRPMKGTATRAPTLSADRDAAAALAADPKNRAENLMIVDLIRNDLSRVATDVAVDALFQVETYPTVHQMTSTISARLKAGHDAVDVIEALFPCGSVTGAPKIRAMEVIADLEPEPRGLYTGSIGVLEPDGDAAFNVAIRTLTLTGGTARLGLGSAIVADSRADDEWDECRAKGAFLTRGARRFDLIETMRFEPGQGLCRLDRHLARLRDSAAYWRFAFDEEALRAALHSAVAGPGEPARLRLVVSASGASAIQLAPLPPPVPEPVAVALAPLPVSPGDARLFHKTTDRAFYDRVRTGFETIFVRPDGLLTEGSFTNLFVERGALLLTPPIGRGLLPGILRAELLETGRAIEADLVEDDLRGGFLIGNSLRGLIRTRLGVEPG